jgi:hypothetical protein
VILCTLMLHWLTSKDGAPSQRSTSAAGHKDTPPPKGPDLESVPTPVSEPPSQKKSRWAMLSQTQTTPSSNSNGVTVSISSVHSVHRPRVPAEGISVRTHQFQTIEQRDHGEIHDYPSPIEDADFDFDRNTSSMRRANSERKPRPTQLFAKDIARSLSQANSPLSSPIREHPPSERSPTRHSDPSGAQLRDLGKLPPPDSDKSSSILGIDPMQRSSRMLS